MTSYMNRVRSRLPNLVFLLIQDNIYHNCHRGGKFDDIIIEDRAINIIIDLHRVKIHIVVFRKFLEAIRERHSIISKATQIISSFRLVHNS